MFYLRGDCMKKIEKLVEMLKQIPPDLSKIETDLRENLYSREELMLALCEYADGCFLDFRDYTEYNGKEAEMGELSSDYMYEICELFIKYGLNVNDVVEGKYGSTNIMNSVRWTYNPRTSAKTFKLLLENKADINLHIDGDSFFRETDFDLIFDITENMTEITNILFEIWLMMVGYGGRLKNGKIPVILYDGYQVKDLKKYENFTFDIIREENDWHMNIIDKRSNKIIGKLYE